MAIDISRFPNPFLDREPAVSARDPALVFHDGIVRCFHTAVEGRRDGHRLFVDVAESTDLVEWSDPVRLTTSPLNFSSPGNVIRAADRWVMCVQSYPIAPGESHGSDASRLWLMTSEDLADWTGPVVMAPDGCQCPWARTARQIDPYLVEHDGRFWCLYKSAGCLGLMVSADLVGWRDAAVEQPVLSPDDTPDGSTVENPCVVRDDQGRFVMFFAPCRRGRGIGVARSEDLVAWRDVRYLDFPDLPWAPGGPTAPMVVDLRDAYGAYVMAFHGDRDGPHGAALGLAFSDDLEHWQCGGQRHDDGE